jgi:hypothetical protein
LLNPDDFIEVTMNDQKMTLFIVCDVPRDVKFETLTRKEISVSPPASTRFGVCGKGIECVDSKRICGLVGDRVGQVVGFANVEAPETQGVGEKVLLGRTVRRVSCYRKGNDKRIPGGISLNILDFALSTAR